MKTKQLSSAAVAGKTLRRALLGSALLLSSSALFAQVKVGDNPTTIATGSALEIESTTKGLRLPQLSLTSTIVFAPVSGSGTAATSPGMQVYNTNAGIIAGSGTNDKLYPAAGTGVYYWDGFGWVSQNSQSFKGYRVVWAASSTGPFTISPSQGYVSLVATETYDPLNAGSSGTFTAPVDGFYTVTQAFSNSFNGSTAYQGSFIGYIRVTPVATGVIADRGQFAYSAQVGFTYPFAHSVTVNLKVGDKVTFVGLPCGGCAGGATYTLRNLDQTVSLFEQ